MRLADTVVFFDGAPRWWLHGPPATAPAAAPPAAAASAAARARDRLLARRPRGAATWDALRSAWLAELRGHAEVLDEYAADEERLAVDFSAAFKKLTELGCENVLQPEAA